MALTRLIASPLMHFSLAGFINHKEKKSKHHPHKINISRERYQNTVKKVKVPNSIKSPREPAA